jgi:hypothetical protein
MMMVHVRLSKNRHRVGMRLGFDVHSLGTTFSLVDETSALGLGSQHHFAGKRRNKICKKKSMMRKESKK